MLVTALIQWFIPISPILSIIHFSSDYKRKIRHVKIKGFGRGSESKVRLVYQPLHNDMKYDSFTLCISVCDSDVTSLMVSNIRAYITLQEH